MKPEKKYVDIFVLLYHKGHMFYSTNIPNIFMIYDGVMLINGLLHVLI